MQSNRIKNISLSPTIRITARAMELKRRKVDLINLNVGEPDVPTPENIKEAARKALENNLTKYTINSGLVELRQAISHRILQDDNLNYGLDELIVSNGAKQCLYNVIMTLINKDDQVIIPGPYYPSYSEMVKLAEGIPVLVMTREENNFKLQPEELEKAVTPQTRAIILCNPSNPTGTVYSKSELTDLTNVVAGRDIYFIADEIYSKLVYDGTDFCSIAAVSDEVKEKSIIISGVSKSYAMTGWRIGYAAANKEIIEGANTIQSHSTSNACTVSQYAAIEAFSGPQDSVRQMRQIFEARRNVILARLAEIHGMDCVTPQGAFYVFPNITSFTSKDNSNIKINNSVDIAEYLLDTARVAVVPGSAFGSDDHIRISYSNSLENINEGIDRISKALSDLLP